MSDVVLASYNPTLMLSGGVRYKTIPLHISVGNNISLIFFGDFIVCKESLTMDDEWTQSSPMNLVYVGVDTNRRSAKAN